jgi:hypothetical protein
MNSSIFQKLSNTISADAQSMLLILKRSRFAKRRIIGTNEAAAEMVRSIDVPASKSLYCSHRLRFTISIFPNVQTSRTARFQPRADNAAVRRTVRTSL